MENELLRGEGAAINGWVYFLGEVNGTDIKVGRSTGAVKPRAFAPHGIPMSLETEIAA